MSNMFDDDQSPQEEMDVAHQRFKDDGMHPPRRFPQRREMEEFRRDERQYVTDPPDTHHYHHPPADYGRHFPQYREPKRVNWTMVILILAIVGLAGYILWKDMQPTLDHPTPPAPVVNPATHYVSTYRDGMHKAWRQALEKFDSKEFRDWQDMDAFLAPVFAEVTTKSEKPGVDAITSINSKLWVAQTPEQEEEVAANRAAARAVIKSFVDGYE